MGDLSPRSSRRGRGADSPPRNGPASRPRRRHDPSPRTSRPRHRRDPSPGIQHIPPTRYVTKLIRYLGRATASAECPRRGPGGGAAEIRLRGRRSRGVAATRLRVALLQERPQVSIHNDYTWAAPPGDARPRLTGSLEEHGRAGHGRADDDADLLPRREAPELLDDAPGGGCPPRRAARRRRVELGEALLEFEVRAHEGPARAASGRRSFAATRSIGVGTATPPRHGRGREPGRRRREPRRRRDPRAAASPRTSNLAATLPRRLTSAPRAREGSSQTATGGSMPRRSSRRKRSWPAGGRRSERRAGSFRRVSRPRGLRVCSADAGKRRGCASRMFSTTLCGICRLVRSRNARATAPSQAAAPPPRPAPERIQTGGRRPRRLERLRAFLSRARRSGFVGARATRSGVGRKA